MLIKTLSRQSRRVLTVSFIALLAGFSGSAFATPVSLGGAGPTDFAVFETGVSSVDVSSLSNGGSITGDVGVVSSGKFTMTGGSTLHGNLYLGNTATDSITGGSTIANGYHTYSNQDSLLNAAAANAASAESTAAGLTPTGTLSTTTLQNGNTMTITTGVYDVSSLTLNYGTLNFSGAGQFIINISGAFSISSSPIINLINGAVADDIIYNITGTTGVNVDSSLPGIILAPTAAVTITNGALLTGEVVSGKDITINYQGVSGNPGSVLGGGNPVPDGGWTVELLALAVFAAEYLRKKLALA